MPNTYVPTYEDSADTVLRHLFNFSSDVVQNAGIVSTTTSSSGATFVVFASNVCKEATVLNLTGTTLSFKRNATGATLDVPDGSYWTFRGLANTSDLSVRRTDSSNSQVTFKAEWEA